MVSASSDIIRLNLQDEDHPRQESMHRVNPHPGVLLVIDVLESRFPLRTASCRIGERYLEWRSTPGMKQCIACGCDIEAVFRRWGSNERALLVLRLRMAWRRVSCVRHWVDTPDFSAEALLTDLDLRVWDAGCVSR